MAYSWDKWRAFNDPDPESWWGGLRTPDTETVTATPALLAGVAMEGAMEPNVSEAVASQIGMAAIEAQM